MKNLFTAAVALICITMAGIAFSACGDDNETFEPPFQTRTLSAAEVCYIVHMPYNGRNICDYIVTYTEADGQEISRMSEKMSHFRLGEEDNGQRFSVHRRHQDERATQQE